MRVIGDFNVVRSQFVDHRCPRQAQRTSIQRAVDNEQRDFLIVPSGCRVRAQLARCRPGLKILVSAVESVPSHSAKTTDKEETRASLRVSLSLSAIVPRPSPPVIGVVVSLRASE